MAHCHYCLAPATTRDHIIPKHRVRKLGLRVGHPFHSLNIVPSCGDCNQRKGNRMPTCDCERCREAGRQYQRLGLNLTPR